jgi:vitamin B12 transporter
VRVSTDNIAQRGVTVSFKNKLLLASCFFSTFAMADPSDYQLEPVVVTATRTSQIVEDTLAPTVIITQEQIKQSQARDIGELLRLHAGLEIGRNGGIGQVTSLFIRGAESDHVLLMIDGVKVNPGTVAGPHWQNINPSLIERIEIVKGPRSSLYGSEAIGGVVNIITKTAQRHSQWSVGATAGGQTTRQLDGSFHAAGENAQAGISVSRFSTHGFPTRTASDLDRGYSNNSAQVYMNTGSENSNTKLSYWHTEGTTEYLSYDLKPKDQDFKDTALSLNSTHKMDNWTQHFKVSRTTNQITENQINDFSNTWDFSSTTRYSLDWQHDVQLHQSNLLTSGIYVAEERTASQAYGRPFTEDQTKTNTSALYLQDQIKSHVHNAVLAMRLTNHEDFGTELSYNMDYGVNISNQLRINVGIGKGFRAPDATDRFGFGGNENLQPEISNSIELGLKLKPSQHQLVGLNLFKNKINNLIQYEGPFFGGQNQNVGRTSITGIELSYRYQQRNLDALLEAVIQEPKNLETNELLERRAKRGLTANVFYHWRNLHPGLEIVAQSERRDINFDDGSPVTLAGYAIVNLSFRAQLRDQWSLTAKLENALDKDYQLAHGFNAQGRLFLVNLSYASQ